MKSEPFAQALVLLSAVKEGGSVFLCDKEISFESTLFEKKLVDSGASSPPSD